MTPTKSYAGASPLMTPASNSTDFIRLLKVDWTLDLLTQEKGNRELDRKFSIADINNAVELLKTKYPQLYESIKPGEIHINGFLGEVQDNGTMRYRGASGMADVLTGDIYINYNNTVAYEAHEGSKAEFLASVIVHEAIHIEYYNDGMIYNEQYSSRAYEEASVRYWTEVWAQAHGLPEVTPGARDNWGMWLVLKIFMKLSMPVVRIQQSHAIIIRMLKLLRRLVLNLVK
jgi:hypothetical protein